MNADQDHVTNHQRMTTKKEGHMTEDPPRGHMISEDNMMTKTIVDHTGTVIEDLDQETKKKTDTETKTIEEEGRGIKNEKKGQDLVSLDREARVQGKKNLEMR